MQLPYSLQATLPDKSVIGYESDVHPGHIQPHHFHRLANYGTVRWFKPYLQPQEGKQQQQQNNILVSTYTANTLYVYHSGSQTLSHKIWPIFGGRLGI